jgi:hypothetical protein
VRREHDRSVVRDFIELIDENRAEPAQPLDDKAVVDDLMANKDRRSEPLEREFDNLDRAVDARTKAARRCDKDAKGRQ